MFQLARARRILQSPRARDARRSLLAGLFLIAVAWVTVYNLRQLQDNPDLGTKYVYSRRAELIREIEGVQPPTKETLINLALGEGMRFVSFLAKTLPEDTSVVFPVDQSGASQPSEFFQYAGLGHFRPYMYPRKLQTEVYDFQHLPYDPLNLSNVPPEYRLVTWNHTNSSQHFVYQVFVSHSAKQYRLFFKSYPVQNQKDYHTEYLFVAYSEAVSP